MCAPRNPKPCVLIVAYVLFFRPIVMGRQTSRGGRNQDYHGLYPKIKSLVLGSDGTLLEHRNNSSIARSLGCTEQQVRAFGTYMLVCMRTRVCVCVCVFFPYHFFLFSMIFPIYEMSELFYDFYTINQKS